jgi:transcriptional regulator with XRE-family HTH domain
MITGEKIRAARKLLGWSRDRLAPRAGLPVNRLGAYELGRRILPLDEVEALKGALEAAGVEFTNGDEPGVKLKATKAQGGK